MELSIDESQRDLLQELLDSAYRDIRYEIADSDRSSYKAMLRERKDAIAALLDLVGGPLPDRAYEPSP